MSEFERLSITVDKRRVAKIKEMVNKGIYPSVSRALDAAAEALIDIETEREIWWAETLRRCDEAERQPELLLSADEFFRRVRHDVAAGHVHEAE